MTYCKFRCPNPPTPTYTSEFQIKTCSNKQSPISAAQHASYEYDTDMAPRRRKAAMWLQSREEGGGKRAKKAAQVLFMALIFYNICFEPLLKHARMRDVVAVSGALRHHSVLNADNLVLITYV